LTVSLTTGDRPNEGGSTYRQIAMICSSVLSLPPLLAAMTPRLMTAKRSTVMPISRNRISAATQTGSSPSAVRGMSAAPVSALSAIGSAILPKSVTRPRLRASCPSRKSVNDAAANAASAASRHAVPPWTRQTTNTGTRRIRTTVSMLAMLTSPTGAGASFAAESLASFTVARLRAGHQVGSCRLHHLSDHQVARCQWPVGEQRRRPVHVRRLVRGAALVPAVADDLLDEHLDGLPHPVGRALGHDLLGEPGELAHPAAHLVRVELVRVVEAGRLGAVLVGVA